MGLYLTGRRAHGRGVARSRASRIAGCRSSCARSRGLRPTRFLPRTARRGARRRRLPTVLRWRGSGGSGRAAVRSLLPSPRRGRTGGRRDGGAFVDEEGTMEIGSAVVESQWNRGYATGGPGARDEGSRELRRRRIVAHTRWERPESGRVLEKAASAWSRRRRTRTRRATSCGSAVGAGDLASPHAACAGSRRWARADPRAARNRCSCSRRSRGDHPGPSTFNARNDHSDLASRHAAVVEVVTPDAALLARPGSGAALSARRRPLSVSASRARRRVRPPSSGTTRRATRSSRRPRGPR